MLRLNRKAQSIVEYVIIIAVAVASVITVYRYIKFAVDQKMAMVAAER